MTKHVCLVCEGLEDNSCDGTGAPLLIAVEFIGIDHKVFDPMVLLVIGLHHKKIV